MTRRRRSAGLALTALLIACGGGGEEGAGGAAGEWIAGNALAVRVTGTGMGGTLEVRNDGAEPAAFAPIRIEVDDQVIADLDAGSAHQSTLGPGESFTFPLVTGGEMEAVRVEMGAGEDREVFTVTM